MPVVFLNSKAFCKLEPVFELAYCNVPEYSDPIKKVVIDRNKKYHFEAYNEETGQLLDYVGKVVRVSIKYNPNHAFIPLDATEEDIQILSILVDCSTDCQSVVRLINVSDLRTVEEYVDPDTDPDKPDVDPDEVVILSYSIKILTEEDEPIEGIGVGDPYLEIFIEGVEDPLRIPLIWIVKKWLAPETKEIDITSARFATLTENDPPIDGVKVGEKYVELFIKGQVEPIIYPYPYHI